MGYEPTYANYRHSTYFVHDLDVGDKIDQADCIELIEAGKRDDLETKPFSHYAPMVQRIVDAHAAGAAS